MRRHDLLALLAALSGAVAVIAGAYGAHGPHGPAAEWLKTGSHYQLVHAVAALALLGRPLGRATGWCFVAGGALFAGTLYAMAFGAPLWFGAITPIGGLLMIAGWLMLAVGAWRGA
ncbi:MAG TPA: DUF423 domain-containing protein [Sphingomonas sp.]|nr:DUF423 domain-containing protein [Sphingomonas sp.]